MISYVPEGLWQRLLAQKASANFNKVINHKFETEKVARSEGIDWNRHIRKRFVFYIFLWL